MKKIISILCVTIFLQHTLPAQKKAQVADSLLTLDEVVITAFEQNREISNGSIVKLIRQSDPVTGNRISLLPAFNTIAGVRMEERSPGSYRINLRGSSLRSPFGVRNVKLYWNDIPVTDAGGNTYFNQFAANNFSTIEIVKGPAGSLYGAGTGGTILMHSLEKKAYPGTQLEYITGSYGLHNIMASLNFGNKNHQGQITYAHNQSGGYRDHSRSSRDNFSLVTRFGLTGRQQITTSLLYNKLYYQTPGGLNIDQYTADQTGARPAAGPFPGAEESMAAIYQQNFTLGINHLYRFSSGIRNSTSIYGSFNQIKNPSIRNYERRSEPGFGGRSSFVYELQKGNTKLQFVAGAELQYGFFNTRVSQNKNGNPDTLQTNDDIEYSTGSFFVQGDLNIKDNWIITAGLSLNRSKVNFTRLSEYPSVKQGRKYKNEVSPRLSLQKKINNSVSLFASAAQGFSPPTVSELLPSNGVISTNLNAEAGTNYETGARAKMLGGRLVVEATVFYFRLNNALVTRKDSSNADYFVNAGNTRQKGLEIAADYAVSFTHSVLNGLEIKSAYTMHDFKYGEYKKEGTDLSGKQLPSVPKNSFSFLVDLSLKQNFYFTGSYYYADKIYLNDINSVAANAYHLMGCRVGWRLLIKTGLKIDLFAGVDNLLNTTYSLGNDINAFGGRFYNAAPKRNFFAGISFHWNKAAEK